MNTRLHKRDMLLAIALILGLQLLLVMTMALSQIKARIAYEKSYVVE